MQVNTSNIYNSYVDYSYLVKELDYNLINFYREIAQLSDYWKSPKARKFFDRIEKERKEAQIMYEELSIIKDVYEYLLEMYSKIGNKIFIDYVNLQTLMLNFEKLHALNNSIIKKYDELLLLANPYYSNILSNQKSIIENLKVKLDEVNSRIVTIVDEIKNIENSTKAKLSNINFQIIKETGISE